MNCVRCGAPFEWDGPGQNGPDQGWYRLSRDTDRGRVCADDNACAARQESNRPTIF